MPKHGQNISYMDAEITGSYFEEMLQTSRRLETATFLLRFPMPSVQNHPFPASRKPLYFRGVLYLSCILEL
jgi:hypothetical protein